MCTCLLARIAGEQEDEIFRFSAVKVRNFEVFLIVLDGVQGVSNSFRWGTGGDSLGGGDPARATALTSESERQSAADSVCGSTARTPAWHEEKRENLRRRSPSSRS